MTEEHIILLGDSILDNHRYVKNKDPAVIDQLKNKVNDLNLNWKTTNCAVDGARTVDLVKNQISTIPDDTTIILLSIGGNDGLKSLRQVVFNSGNWLPWRLYSILMNTKNKFNVIYAEALQKIIKKCPNAHIIVCTVYYPIFPRNAMIQMICNIGINILSNVIIKSALKYGNIPIIDLRYVFDKKQDYANSIEPGVPGGNKIINNLVNIVQNHNFNKKFTDKNKLIYKSVKYSNNLNPFDYTCNYWKMTSIQQQQGSAATIFFRRAFDERKNDNIKLYFKVGIVSMISIAIAAGYFYWKYGKNVSCD